MVYFSITKWTTFQLYYTYEWEEVAAKIGGLGYAYARSKKYGPKGDKVERERLKNVLYSAIIAYTDCVPIEGSDIKEDGKPIGRYTGDGFSNLKEHCLIANQVATHQWTISDALITPCVHLMPDIQSDIRLGDKQAQHVYDSLVRFLQSVSAEIVSRRSIDNPNERWGEIRDTLRTSGAWADANLGHRSRMLLALPIIWADYNRPMTYVQYWYSDFYNDKPFEGFSFSPGWSPHGVVPDVSRWLTKYIVPSHRYAQSGYQPDGTISHHIANATDMAMVAYGFEWLTDCFTGFNQFKNTDFKLADKYYQFPADRLTEVYPKMIYKGRFDFLASGRSYLDDLEKFVSKTYLDAFQNLVNSKSKTTRLTNQEKFDNIYKNIKNHTHEYSVTEAFWVNEYLVHRRGENEKPFYASVKLKSKRTVGAEDFGKVRKSWHAGYGILPLKIRGDEYSHTVLSNMDWHMLPGLTEEWRDDALPATGGAQASLPGDNTISGVTADGESGMAIYHHLPRETYSSSTAYKSYHFIDNKIIALGTGVQRLRTGQQKEIATCIDQSSLVDMLTISYNGKVEKISPTRSVNLEYTISSPVWIHTGEKGYIIYPEGEQKLIIKTGANINITDREIATDTLNYIIAISHGTNPDSNTSNHYYYHLVPNVTTSDMDRLMDEYTKNIECVKDDSRAHSVYSSIDKIWQAAFFEATTCTIGGIMIKASDPSQIILKDAGNSWKLTIGNPIPDINKQQLELYVSIPLKPGKYSYRLGGIYPRDGEYVTITKDDNGSRLIVELPDKRDDEFYSYQTELYNAAPVTIVVPKK